MSSLSPRLFWNLGRYPSLLIVENQWGENGWLYDPEADRFIRYDLDRKEQSDRIIADMSREEFAARVRPKVRAPLRRWFDALSSLRVGDDVWVWNGSLLRRYGPAQPNERGRPISPMDRVAPEDAPEPVRAWLAATRR